MSKKRDLYNMYEYNEDGGYPPEDEDDGEEEEYYPYGYSEEAVDPEAYGPYDGQEIYPEETRGGYMDEEFAYDTKSKPQPIRYPMEDEEEEADFYDMYNPDFQKFLLRNGMIKFDSDDDEDSDDSDDDSDDSDLDTSRKSRRKKTTSRKKSTKKKSTKKKR